MIFDLKIKSERLALVEKVSKLVEEGLKTVEFKLFHITRNNLQNRALHLFFRWISDLLNELGLMHKFSDLDGKPRTTRFTEHIIKYDFWHKDQQEAYGIDSTKDLTTTMINELAEMWILWFAERGMELRFPNKEDLIKSLKHDKNHVD